MAFAFSKKLKAAGLPRMSAKIARMGRLPKLSKTTTPKVHTPKGKTYKPFNFSKFTKAVKIKSPKVVAIKRVIKKLKK